MNKKVTRFLVLFITVSLGGLPLLQQTDAQSSPQSGFLSDVVQKSSNYNQHVNSRISLESMLRYLESKYNVMFLYQDADVANKYVPSPEALLSRDPGGKLANLLNELHLTYAKIDSATYVIFSNGINSNYKVLKKINFSVSGKVTDATSGEPLPGVNVVVKGTTIGTATNKDGVYNLSIPGSQDTLVYSYIGYQTKMVPVNDQHTMNVRLQMKAVQGQEMVVVGYGSEKKQDLTGSVGTISFDNKVKSIPVPNTSSLLQGRIPGVTVSNFDNQPGRNDATINIRGIGTLNAGSNPLVVIDGVPSSIDAFSQTPASDIANITVLKDAASAAIYGSRAANGVILVQTKRGHDMKPQVDFNSTLTYEQPAIMLKLMNSADYAFIENQWALGAGEQAPYSQADINAIKSGSQPDLFANTNWPSLMYRTAPMIKNYLSVSGGTKTAQYMVSAEYFDQKGILIGTSANRYNIRSNLDIHVNDRFHVGLDLAGYKRRINETLNPVNGGGDNSLVYSIRRFTNPTVPLKYSNGDWGVVNGLYPAYGNPIRNVVEMAHLGQNYTDLYNVNGQLFGEYNILHNLQVKSTISGTYNGSYQSKFNPTNLEYDAAGNIVSNNALNSLANNQNASYHIINNNLVTYTAQLNRHHFKAIVGESYEYYRQNTYGAYAENFPNNNIRVLSAGTANFNVSGNIYDYALLSFFGRLNYNYDGKYLFEFNLRHDGTSRLPASNRYGNFPSVSVGWIVSQEKFLKKFLGPVSFLKFRASWGQLGNQEIGDYPYAQTLATGQDYVQNGALAGGVAVTSLANSNIKWETTTMTDAGVDLNLFNDDLQFTADYFDKATSGILLRLPIPMLLGNVTAPYQNAGKVDNKGWEINVNYSHTFNRVGINAGFNISHVQNKIVNLGGLGKIINGATIDSVGYPIGAYYGYISNGFFQNQSEIDNHAKQFGNLAPGDIKYVDLNGPAGKPDGIINATYDRTIIGNPFPKYTFAFNFGADYRGFSLSAFFQGIAGVKRFNWINTENAGNFTYSLMNYWKPSNPNAKFPRFTNTANNYANSTFWLQDASYLRLKDLELGYTLPSWITRSLSMSSIRIYLSGYNLLTWTKYESFDPEKAAGDQRNRNYPAAKAYAMGIDLKF